MNKDIYIDRFRQASAAKRKSYNAMLLTAPFLNLPGFAVIWHGIINATSPVWIWFGIILILVSCELIGASVGGYLKIKSVINAIRCGEIYDAVITDIISMKDGDEIRVSYTDSAGERKETKLTSISIYEMTDFNRRQKIVIAVYKRKCIAICASEAER